MWCFINMFWVFISHYFCFSFISFLVTSGLTYGSTRAGVFVRSFPFIIFSCTNDNDIAVTWVLACGGGRELVEMAELSLKGAQPRWPP